MDKLPLIVDTFPQTIKKGEVTNPSLIYPLTLTNNRQCFPRIVVTFALYYQAVTFLFRLLNHTHILHIKHLLIHRFLYHLTYTHIHQ